MRPVLALVGPTATGKSGLAVEVAQALAARGQLAEVINVDAQLVYRGMDIGTAKPTEAERGGVPHHLIDILDIHDEASVADFQRLARDAISTCRAHGVTPILVGGSALYVRAVVDDFDFPGTEPAVRARLEAELADVGPAALHTRLRGVAPEVAREILPTNGRRIVRALEVVELTGSFRATLPDYHYVIPGVVQVGLEIDRAGLDHRIDARVIRMRKLGFTDEVRQLESAGLRDGRTASAALGYRQLLAHLAGQCSEDDAYSETAVRTRKFARKQLGWFRRDPRIQWVVSSAPDRLERVLAALGGVC